MNFWSQLWLVTVFSAFLVIFMLGSLLVVNVLIQTNGNVQLTGNSGNFLSSSAPHWKIMHPSGLSKSVSIYENYNIPPLSEYMNIMPSSRYGMACCSSIHKEMVTCFGGYGITVNKEVNMSKADRIKSNNAILYKYGVLDDYWSWSNLNYSWWKIGDKLPSTGGGTYHGGCWTGSNDKVWFGGGLVREGQSVVVGKKSFHTYNSTVKEMPRLAKFSYWTDHSGKFMYLFGGHDDLLRFSNELWRITTMNTSAAGNWSMIMSGGPIEPRINAAAFQYDKTIYIFGGESLIHSCFGDLWMLVDKRWTKLYGHDLDKLVPNHRGQPHHPGCRKQSTVIPVHEMNQVKIRGGLTNGNLTMTDTWIFSVTKSKWTWYEGNHHANVLPFEDPVTSKVLSLPAFYNSAHWVDHLGHEYYFGGCSEQCTVLYNWVWTRR